jgi:hypothetical protein
MLSGGASEADGGLDRVSSDAGESTDAGVGANEAGDAADAGVAARCMSAASELDGGCGDPQTDPHNCGACGHDCGGGACEGGVCGPTPQSAIATGQYLPTAIAVDDTSVYWINAGVPGGPGGKVPPIFTGAQVLKCAIAGCRNSPTVLADIAEPGSGYGLPSALALDSASVYWVAGGSVLACSKTGCSCSPTVIAAQVDARAVAVSSDTVYFTSSSGSVGSCPVAGCTGGPSSIATGQVGPAGITLDPATLYWADNSAVMACALGGCLSSPAILWQGKAGSSQANTTGIAVDGDNLYWTNAQPLQLGDVMQCPKSNCEGGLVTLGSARTEPRGIAVDGADVYWFEATGVMKCTIGGCNDSPTIVAAATGQALAVDAARVYYADFGSNARTDGRIMVVSK